MSTTSRRQCQAAFVGRFVLLHLVAYAVVGGAVLALLPALPAADRAALAFFEPYRPLGPAVVAAQAARAGVIAVVLLPVADRVFGRERGWLVLFGLVWGLAVVGSIEGVIYTEATFGAHAVALVATALHWAAVTWAFAWWEARADDGTWATPSEDGPGRLGTVAYVARFALLLSVVYLTAGLAFFTLQDYEAVLATREAFALYRPLDHPLVQGAALVQLGRGAFTALVLRPVYGGLFEHRRGWLRLFGLLWGLSFLGAPNAVQGLATGLVAAGSLSGILFGTAEVTAQLAVLSVLAWAWERRAARRRA